MEAGVGEWMAKCPGCKQRVAALDDLMITAKVLLSDHTHSAFGDEQECNWSGLLVTLPMAADAESGAGK